MPESSSFTHNFDERSPLLSKGAIKLRDFASLVSSPLEVLERGIVKFWVLPSNCLDVKREISCIMPECGDDRKRSFCLAESGSWISDIYFDTAKLKLYKARLWGFGDSILLRWRWYSKDHPTQPGYMEEEIIKGDSTIKRRILMSSGNCNAFLKDGRANSIGHGDQQADMYKDLQKIGAELHPKIRATYRRTVFQDYERKIRVTFDEDVHLISISNFEEGLWVDVEQAMNNAFLFPLAILEVKLDLSYPGRNQGGYHRVPTWFDHLLARGMITRVHNFSKYLTSVSCFHLNEVERAPAWLEAARTMVSIEMLKQDTEILGTIEKSEDMPQKIELVETRTFMANERTFLKWTRMCFLSFFFGISLIGLGVDPVIGMVLAICSLLTLVRSYYVYNQRLKMIQSTKYKQRYDDKYGPHFLLLLFVIPALVHIIRLMISKPLSL